jgi:hypothetical protein
MSQNNITIEKRAGNHKDTVDLKLIAPCVFVVMHLIAV